MEQISMFDYCKTPLKIDKPIRLIELFAGIGSQAKALQRLGADFEHYRVCEFDKYAIKSYNAIHGTDFAISDITQITAADLGIVDTDKYCYIMTYSFPCQDLSLAGKQKGMAKGENTRSGLLWEVERLLNECAYLPQVLLMENVTQVHGTKNKEHFDEWIAFLESKGYSNYWQDLNAKNFGIPQNRNRTFMVSVLGDYTYEFPQEFSLELRLKDMLEDSVDEKYYLSDRAIQGIANSTYERKQYIVQKKDWCDCILSRDYKDPKCVEVGMLSGGKWDKMHDVSRRVYSGQGLSPTLHTCGGGNTEPKNVEPSIQKIDIPQTVRVRKYEVDCKLLCEMLRNYKSASNFNNQEIADRLNVSRTKVEHWFRQDDCFAIPDPEIWFKLKSLLGIKTDEFDKAIMTFEEKQGVFEKSNRCYFPNGIAPTITCASENEKVIEPKIIREEPLEREGWHDHAKEVISPQGVCRTLCAQSNNLVTKIKEPYNLRIRKLTPKECWRLMGFDDTDFEKAEKVNSNSQLYKQAGNSIVVDVLFYIFREML